MLILKRHDSQEFVCLTVRPATLYCSLVLLIKSFIYHKISAYSTRSGSKILITRQQLMLGLSSCKTATHGWSRVIKLLRTITIARIRREEA